MKYLLTAAQMKAADDYTSNTIGIPSIVLMERAALAVAEAVEGDFPDTSSGKPVKVAVLAGKGNNGADGVAAGRILQDRGFEVMVCLTCGMPAEGTLLSRQLDIFKHGSGKVQLFDAAALFALHPAVLIDAMTGIGLHEGGGAPFPAQAAYAAQSLRQLDGTRVYAVDMPSGVLADSGQIVGTAIRADVTITFGYAKRGQLLYPGVLSCGSLRIADIGINERSRKETAKGLLMYTYDRERAEDLLPGRLPSGNKGSFGKVLVIAGSRNMCGAALLCGRACARSGAGMVRIFTEECNREIVQISSPEFLLGTYDPDGLEEESRRKEIFDHLGESLSWADTVVIGPGLGRTEAAQYLVTFTLAWLEKNTQGMKGLVIDADAIRIIGKTAQLADMAGEIGRKMPVIYTPHMAECAALLGITVDALKAALPEVIKEYADAHHCCILCKDARSLVVSWDHPDVYMNSSGNDSLSTAGSGDVLSGMTGAFVGQGMEGFDAAVAASYLHGRAAELLSDHDRITMLPGGKGQANHNTRSLMAGDLLDGLRDILAERVNR